MADKIAEKDYTQVNFTMVDDLTTEWSSTSTEFEGSIQKAVPDPTFTLLESMGYSGGFPGKFDEATQSLVSNVNSAIAAAKSYFEELKKEDETLAGLFPEAPKTADPPASSGGGGGGSSGKDNSAEQCQYFKDISLSDLRGIIDVLTKYAAELGITVDELLNDVQYAEKLKELLLSSPNISEAYKTLVEEGSGEATMTALKSLMNADIPEAIGLTNATQLTTKKYLTAFAEANNLSYEDLVGKEENSKILRKALSNMADVSNAIGMMNEGNVQSMLTSIIDGSFNGCELSNSAKVLIQTHMKALSELSGSSITEILTDESFKKDLYESMENLDRFVAYTGGLSACGGAGKTISKIIV